MGGGGRPEGGVRPGERGAGRAIRTYRALLRLLPADFRRRHGRAMEATFGERVRAARGSVRIARLLLRETADLLLTAARLRATQGLTTWRDDLGNALRSLRRSPAGTAFAALTLALGMGATTALFSALDSVILRPLAYPAPERVVMLYRSQNQGAFMIAPTPEQARAWEGLGDVFEAVEPYGGGRKVLSGRGDATPIGVVRVRPSFLPFAGVAPVMGRAFTEEERLRDARVALVSEALWAGPLGRDPGVLGETLTLDGEAWTVVGVLPTRAAPPGPLVDEADVWIPLSPDTTTSTVSVLARLREGVSRDVAAERAGAVGVPDTPSAGEWGVVVRTVADGVGRSVRDALLAVAFAAALLLLIGCLNVSNLLLARAEARLHESAVRSALGAGRGRLVRQHLLESLALAALAGGAGVLVAHGLLAATQALRPERLQILDRASLDGRVLAFALIVSTATGLLFGLLPAWRGASTRALGALRSGRSAHRERGARGTASGLVVAEVALSFLLLTGTGILLRTVVDLQRADVGFQAAGLLAVEVPLPEWRYPDEAERRAVMESLLERTAALPGVEEATLAVGSPPELGIWFGRPAVEGAEPLAGDESRIFFYNSVDADYFRVLRQPLLRGRGFTAAEAATGAPVAVISESAARALFDGEALGRRFRVGSGTDWWTVVGVAREVRASGLSGDVEYPQLYRPSGSDGAAPGTLVLRTTGEPSALAPRVRELVRSVDPEVPLRKAASVGDLYAGTLARERFTLALLAVFAATALVLAAVGLYGVVAQVVGRRTREIGIRMSLGAERSGVFRMVLGQGLAATGMGVLVGAALAAAGARLLSAGLFGVQPADPGVWLGAAAVLAMAATGATWLPARRAARVDPVRAMRSE